MEDRLGGQAGPRGPKHPGRRTSLGLCSEPVPHSLRPPALSSNPNPAVQRREKTLLVPSARVLHTRDSSLWISPVRVTETLGCRSPRPRFQGSPWPRAPPTTPSPRCFQPEARTRPSRLPTPKAAREPTPLNFCCRPSAARCCPLTAGPGASLPWLWPAESQGPATLGLRCRAPLAPAAHRP